MRKFLLTVTAVSLLTPVISLPSASAKDRSRTQGQDYQEWRGRDGRLYCRKSDGTTGLVVGAVGGALIGRTIDRHGDRTLGTLLGAAAGGLLGKEIDSKRRCE